MIKEENIEVLTENVAEEEPAVREVGSELLKTASKKKPRRRRGKQPACIEYHGGPGVTQPCLDAVIRLIQFGDQITKAQILSADGDPVTEHCFLLTVNDDLVAIKSGFASGYRGNGLHRILVCTRST